MPNSTPLTVTDTEIEQLRNRVTMLEQTLGKMSLSDKFLFQKPIVGGPNGLRLGSMAKDKLAFYNAAPIAQWTSGAGRQDSTSNTGAAANVGFQATGNLGGTGYSLGDVVALLKTIGLLGS